MLWWGHGASGWIGMLLFWALVVGLIYLLVRPSERERRSDPRDVLAERFARGEIDEEEYRERERVLDASR